jgi:hypothetical protein
MTKSDFIRTMPSMLCYDLGSRYTYPFKSIFYKNFGVIGKLMNRSSGAGKTTVKYETNSFAYIRIVPRFERIAFVLISQIAN